MALHAVHITPEVYLACTSHALSTEAEEVMGLLLGSVQAEGDKQVAYIWKAVPQVRADRRKDRVESSPAQVAECTALAEALTSQTGIPTRVVGWYHSHPHITVLPSHVDVQTQALYQMMDPCFVGLIWSVFNHDPATQQQEVQVTAFQSQDAAAAAAASGEGGVGSSGLAGVSSVELEGLDQALKDALRHSAAEAQSHPSGLVRREVPLVLQPHAAPHLPCPLHDFVSVQKLLHEEEEQLYGTRPQQLSRAASGAASGTRDAAPTKPSPAAAAAADEAAAALAQLQQAAQSQQALSRLIAGQLSAAVVALQGLQRQQQVQKEQLLAEQQVLQHHLGKSLI